ncbi:sulfatase [Actinoplanes sp. NPDC049265]|uniref:sulfatase n=1 Tax=Actinoplanes sp. NPDC049265 TaxID=3363902 RepID=UPI003718C434
MTNRLRSMLPVTLTVLAAVLLFVALVVPDSIGRLRPGTWVPGAFLRLPIEGIVAAAVLLIVPERLRRPAAITMGAGIGVLALLKIINIGFLNVLARRFDLVLDWPLFGDGFNYVEETSGKPAAVAAVAGAIVGGLALIAALAWAMLRLSGYVARHRRLAQRAVPAGIAAWVALALVGVTLFPYAPVASDTTAMMARNTLASIPRSIQDQRAFAAEAANDPFAQVPAGQLLRALRGKDVMIGVVESYGRSALENPKMAAILNPALDAANANLEADGFHARSGFLTSSTYGGGSWLAHASFQSGMWVNQQQRYRQLTAGAGNRLTLTRAFQKAGWHTVGIEPGNKHTWPEKDFYGYEEVWDSRNLGYHGPQFGWSSMPDQFTLSSFQRNVYSRPDRGPLLSEVTLTSSHTPWAPLPKMIGWDQVGDGSVYGPMVTNGPISETWTSTGKVRTAYATSVGYSVTALTSWATKYGSDDLVIIMFGDHQAAPRVSGVDASHDVPISIISKDPAVFDRIASWGWQDGLRPDEDAPVTKMDAFRDKFLTAYAAPAGSKSH